MSNYEWKKIIGFTGTRRGMSMAQMHTVRLLLREIRPVEVHHGCCIGADAEFHNLARAELPGCIIIGHPGPEESMQARRALTDCDHRLAPKSHFARNRDIVECSPDGLIGAPHLEPLPSTGGTAYTIRYAWKRRKHVWVAWPNGDVIEQEGADATDPG